MLDCKQPVSCLLLISAFSFIFPALFVLCFHVYSYFCLQVLCFCACILFSAQLELRLLHHCLVFSQLIILSGSFLLKVVKPSVCCMCGTKGKTDDIRLLEHLTSSVVAVTGRRWTSWLFCIFIRASGSSAALA